MTVKIEIPDEVAGALRLPQPELERELTRELALGLYARWGLPFGPARRMAKMSKREFLAELASRGIERHYSAEDLAEDVEYAQSRQQ
jgi:predicted HTH domain antitoxin